MSAVLDQYWLLLILLGVGVIAVGFGLSDDGPVARRIFGQFFLLIALPLLVVLGAFLIAISQVFDLDERVWSAIIAGSVIATGWLTTTIFNVLGKSQDKAERLRDYHRALYAEIQTVLDALYQGGHAEAYAAETVAKMRGDESFVPFIPRERHDRVYSALVEEIEVLPRQTIDAIISFYSVMDSMVALAGDMRAEEYQNLPQARRIVMYEDYFARRVRAFEYGRFALSLIKCYAEKGPSAADALKNQLSSRVEARSPHPSQGSE